MNDTEMILFKLIAEFEDDPRNRGGGNLHIILEDQNCETDHIQWCLDQCIDKMDDKGAMICKLMLALPFNRRLRAAYTAPYIDLAQPPHWIEIGDSMLRTGQDGGGSLVRCGYASDHGFCVWPDSAEEYEDHAVITGHDLFLIGKAIQWHMDDLALRTGRKI